MWRGGGPAGLLTGEIIANKATPLRMIDRLQGKAPPARNLCSVEPVSAQIPTLEHDVRASTPETLTLLTASRLIT